MIPSPEVRCSRCGDLVPPDDPLRGYCSRQHRREAQAQRHALRDAGPGCATCYRGCVFFAWKEGGGRVRLPPLNLEARHAAPCTCPAGQRIRLKSGYKTWGYMRDSGPEGQDEMRPAPSVVARARVRGGP